MPDISRNKIEKTEKKIDVIDIDLLEKLANKHIDINYLSDCVTEKEKRESAKDFLYEDYSWVTPFMNAILCAK